MSLVRISLRHILALTLLCFFGLFLSACGGGGGSGGGGTEDTSFSLSVSSSKTIEEGETAVFSLTYNNASGVVSLVANSSDISENEQDTYQLTTNTTNRTVSLNVGALEQDKVVTISLLATDSQNTQVSKTLTVNIVNASLTPKVDELKAIKNHITDIYAYKEENALIDVLTTLALINHNMDSETIALHKANVEEASSSQIQAQINDLLEPFDSSDESMAFPSTFIESEVDSTLALIHEYLADYVAPVNLIIEDIQMKMESTFVPNIPLGRFYYIASQSSISQFYGNPSLSTNAQTPIFYSQFSFLDKIAFPESQTCLISNIRSSDTL